MIRALSVLVAVVYLLGLASAEASPPEKLYFYNLTGISSEPATIGYETEILIAALQGLSNRYAPTLYVRLQDIDDYWLNVVGQKWLQDTEVEDLTPDGLVGLVSHPVLSQSYKGVVLFDSKVWSSSLAAETVAGAEDLLPVCHRPDDATSLYSQLVASGPKLPVVKDLSSMFRGKTSGGSTKRYVYEWVIQNYVNATTNGQDPKSDASVLGYYIDSYWESVAKPGEDYEKVTAMNHDWIVARRGVFFDLDFWGDEAPVDEPTQPPGTDLGTARELLRAAWGQTQGKRPIHIAGFTPWAYKYVKQGEERPRKPPSRAEFRRRLQAGGHAGVATEWHTVDIASAYDAYFDADACCVGNMANAAFFMHAPRSPTPSVAFPVELDLVHRGVLNKPSTFPPSLSVPDGMLIYYFYFGDFDSAAWLYSQMPSRWSDANKRNVPIGWAVDPELALRMPVMLDQMASTMAQGPGSLISGDSGAGYLNPSQLFGAGREEESGLPDGRRLWQAHNRAWYNHYGITATGFVIDGDAGPMTPEAEAIYAPFSPNGIVDGGPAQAMHMNGDMPVMYHVDLSEDVNASTAQIMQFLPKSKSDKPAFMMFRSVLSTPTFLSKLQQSVSAASSGRAVAVNPLEAAYLARVATADSPINAVRANDNRAQLSSADLGNGTWWRLTDSTVNVSSQFTAQISNTGWDDWNQVGSMEARINMTVWAPTARFRVAYPGFGRTALCPDPLDTEHVIAPPPALATCHLSVPRTNGLFSKELVCSDVDLPASSSANELCVTMQYGFFSEGVPLAGATYNVGSVFALPRDTGVS